MDEYFKNLKQFRLSDIWFFTTITLACILLAAIDASANLNINSTYVAVCMVIVIYAYVFLVVKKRKIKK